MKKIAINGIRGKDKFALVDDEDFSKLNDLNWCLDSKGYATKWSTGDRKNRHHIYMHRLINQTPDGLETDHVDGNRLNNQKHNLRSVTHLENTRNNHFAKGVGWHKGNRKWRAYITLNKKQIELGYFANKKDAEKKRKEAKILYFNVPA